MQTNTEQQQEELERKKIEEKEWHDYFAALVTGEDVPVPGSK
jgi:hypothetical protein